MIRKLRLAGEPAGGAAERLDAAQEDAQTLKNEGTADDLDELVTWSAAHPTLDD